MGAERVVEGGENERQLRKGVEKVGGGVVAKRWRGGWTRGKRALAGGEEGFVREGTEVSCSWAQRVRAGRCTGQARQGRAGGPGARGQVSRD